MTGLDFLSDFPYNNRAYVENRPQPRRTILVGKHSLYLYKQRK